MNPAPQTNPANPQPTPIEGRDAGGRFAKGNPGGPGNPYPRRVAALKLALLNCVTEEDIVAIAKAVIEEAKAGNIPAAKLIFQYVLGKPGTAADLELPAPIANGANGDVFERPAAPKANGANGNAAEPPAAPKANGSNGGKGAGSPSGFSPKAEQWLDRQVRLATEALGSQPLVSGI
jgi:hypothetical protein